MFRGEKQIGKIKELLFKTEKEGADILFFDNLDKKSQGFVLEVKALSEMPEEEFIKTNARAIENYKLTIGEDMFPKASESFASIWELTTYYLSLLKDVSELGPGIYNRRTEHLADTFLSRFFDLKEARIIVQSFSGEVGYLRDLLEYFDKKSIPENVNEKIILMNNIIQFVHWRAMQGGRPVFSALVKDFWRFDAKHHKDIKYERSVGFNTPFFDGLSNLRSKSGEEVDDRVLI